MNIFVDIQEYIIIVDSVHLMAINNTTFVDVNISFLHELPIVSFFQTNSFLKDSSIRLSGCGLQFNDTDFPLSTIGGQGISMSAHGGSYSEEAGQPQSLIIISVLIRICIDILVHLHIFL